jgi:alpha-mannosidase
LIRSPNNPDPDADQGQHQFTYSILPHNQNFIQSDVIAESSILNQQPILFKDAVSQIEIPIRLEGDGVELSVLKKAEKEDYLIIRIVETSGRHSNGSLKLNGTLTECDLMEWNDMCSQTNVDESVQLNLKPFEIRTFRLNTIGK